MPTEDGVQNCLSRSGMKPQPLHLTLYHSMLVKLLEIGNSDLDLLTCSDDELTNVILELPCLQLKYDTNSKVTELSPVDI